jgi:hypothetical protein
MIGGEKHTGTADVESLTVAGKDLSTLVQRLIAKVSLDGKTA